MGASTLTLEGLYAELPPPEDGDGLRFSAVAVPTHRFVRVARGVRSAALLFEAKAGGRPRPPIRLRHIRVLFGARCRVIEAGAVTDGSFTLVECDQGDGDLEAHFFRAFEALLPSLREEPSEVAIGSAVDAMVELFRVASAPPLTSVRGLWAELFLIAQAYYPDTLIAAWHAIPNERFDFAAADQRIEVKSTARARRARFGLEQLLPLDLLVAVYSTVVEPTPAGSTIGDLVKAITARISDGELAQKLVVGVAHALGSDFVAWDGDRFDEAIARDQCRFLRADTIPRMADPPPQITDVRFTVDLAGVPAMPLSELESLGDLVAAARPVS
jgi:hypothetical protein